MGFSPTQATQLVDTCAGGFLRPLRHRKQEPATGANFISATSRAGQPSGVQVAESKVARGDVAELVRFWSKGQIATRDRKSLSSACGWRGSPKAIVEREGLAQTTIPARSRLRRRVLPESNVSRLSRGKDQRRGLLGRPDHEASREKRTRARQPDLRKSSCV